MRSITKTTALLGLVLGFPGLAASQAPRVAELPADLAVRRPEGSPILSIGQEGGPAYELYRVTDARWTDSGRIVIANSGSSEIKVFDSDGALLATHGRSGRGPGEFLQLASVHPLPNGRLVTWDTGLRRASVFSILDGFEDTILFDPSLPGAQLEGVTTTGAFVVTDTRYGGAGAGELGRLVEHRFLYGADGVRVDSLGSAPGPEGLLTSRGSGMEMRPSLFDFATNYAVTGDGLWIQTSRTAGVTRQSLVDGTTRTVRWRDGNRGVTDADVAAAVEAQLEASAVTDPERRQWLRRDFEGRPVPEFLPETTGLIGDRERGVAWVADSAAPRRPSLQRWLVVGADGAVSEEVRLPSGMELRDARGDEVLVLERDAFGLEYVRVYRINDLEGA